MEPVSALMRWTPLSFGKHMGKSIPQVMFADPGWFFYLYQKGAFDAWYSTESNAVYHRSRSIKVPQPVDTGDERKIVEHIFLWGTFRRVQLVPESEPQHHGAGTVVRKRVIDMSMPWSMNGGYDKLGGQLMISGLKGIIFGDPSYKMTKKRCEEFFNDHDNFDFSVS